ncbi:hypothetical protein NJZ95_23135, partial [Salmonella sp. S87]|nr:hypothetical protein [Salmonella sp. S87]
GMISLSPPTICNSADFTRKHQHLSKVLHTWNEVVSQSKP